MILWIDGDSCARKALDIALDHQGRNGLKIVVVADRLIPGVLESGADMRKVPHGTGLVDQEIIASAGPHEIALTRDYGLGISLVEAGIRVINDRGRIWNLDDLRKRAEDAAIMKAMRSGGMVNRGMASYSQEDAQCFSATLKNLIWGRT